MKESEFIDINNRIIKEKDFVVVKIAGTYEIMRIILKNNIFYLQTMLSR